MSDKSVTIRVCKNILYLAELKGINYTHSVEEILDLSRGYLSRCLAHPNKRIAVDVVLKAADIFYVNVEDLIKLDLRQS